MNYYSWPNLVKLKVIFLLMKLQPKLKGYSNSYIITGMPRGGTTWMAEVLNTIPNSLYLHEPLKKGRIKAFDDIGFDWHQYIPENAEWPEAQKLFKQLLNGQILNPALIERTANMGKILATEHFVIKFVRLNRMLPWLMKNFPGINPPVYIIRHPCAIVYSQLNHGAWDYARQISYPYKLKMPCTKFGGFYSTVYEKIGKIRSIEQHLALSWCLDALPLFHEYNNKKWITVSYEQAVQNKSNFIEKLFQRLNLSVDAATVSKLNAPSSSTQKINPLRLNPQEQITKWMTKLSKRQKDDIQEILDLLSIDFYSVTSPEPDYTKLVHKNLPFSGFNSSY